MLMMRLWLAAVILTVICTCAIVGLARASPPTLPTLIAETEVATWKCQDQLQLPRTQYSIPPWKLPKSRLYRQWTLQLWQQRHAACLIALHERARQWNWQAFLPDKWRRVGICETGLNWRHANGQYVSAFGISRREYDRDAASMHAPPWNDARPPSPWDQYQAALGHYHRFGGFSGWSCRGA
jgi:hypothetical protein